MSLGLRVPVGKKTRPLSQSGFPQQLAKKSDSSIIASRCHNLISHYTPTSWDVKAFVDFIFLNKHLDFPVDRSRINKSIGALRENTTRG